VSECFPQPSMTTKTTKTNRTTPDGQESHRKVPGSGLARLGIWSVVSDWMFLVMSSMVHSSQNTFRGFRRILYPPKAGKFRRESFPNDYRFASGLQYMGLQYIDPSSCPAYYWRTR
jgi:hypothetical protein